MTTAAAPAPPAPVDIDDDIQATSTTHPEPASPDPAAPQPAATTTPSPAKAEAAPAGEVTKDETPAPAAAEDDEAPREGESPQQTAARTRSRLQIRINELTKARYTAEGEAKETRAQLAERDAELARLRAEPGQSKTQTSTATPGAVPGDDATAIAQALTSWDQQHPRPKAEDFDDIQAYEDALVDWKVDRRDVKKDTEARVVREREARDQAIRDERHLQQTAVERAKAFTVDHPDFDAVIRAGLDFDIHKTVMRELRASDHGPAILYALAKDPTDAKRFSELSIAAQVKEIGRREALLERTAATTEPPKPATRPKPTTHAPEPIEPEGGPAASVRTLEDLDTDDYVDEVNKREREGRRR
jgi:hypothetical protein